MTAPRSLKEQWNKRWGAARHRGLAYLWAGAATAATLAALWAELGPWRNGGSRWEAREWKIGTDNARPYHFFNSDGTTGGMAAEVLNEAARRSGVRLKWVLRPEGPTKALRSGTVDIWPLLSFQRALWPDIHFTKPYLRNSYIIVCSGECEIAGSLRSVRRVALVDYPLVRKLAQQSFPLARIIGQRNREEALSLVCRGGADVAFMESRVAQHLLLQRPPGCSDTSLQSYGMDVPPTELAITSTAAGAPAAERLRTEIDRMLADGTMAQLMRKWNYYYSGETEGLYEEEQARRAGRLATLLAAILGLVVIALLVLVARTRQARREAQAASMAKSQFLATMSHEIRTPLHGLLGMSQLLRESDLKNDQREYVEMLEQSGRALLELVNDVLDLARVEQGKVELILAAYEPTRLFSAALRAWEPQARAKGVELRAEGLERMPARAMGDEARIRQVLANLLSNAVKFTAQGSVTLAVRMVQDERGIRAVVEVRDTGIGISAGALARIFDQFSQADQTISHRYGGTGLGLSIAKKLVELMGGAMEVRSEPGVGSTFRITLPMPEPPAPASETSEDATGRQTPPEAGAGAPAGTRQVRPAARILLAEDNPVNQTIARKLLERAGFQVSIVTGGEQALEALEQETYAAVFMDCRMPGMDGLTATAELRRRGKRLPVIALTASAMSQEREQCLAAGMDDYLTKPLDLAELDRVLRRWVRVNSQCDNLAHIPQREGGAK